MINLVQPPFHECNETHMGQDGRGVNCLQSIVACSHEMFLECFLVLDSLRCAEDTEASEDTATSEVEGSIMATDGKAHHLAPGSSHTSHLSDFAF